MRPIEDGSSAGFFMVSTGAVHFAVHRRSVSASYVPLHSCEIDDSGDGVPLLVPSRGGVPLLHLFG
jgi:hypothetical protein